MLIYHKRVASNETAVLQACHMADVHATMQPHRQCASACYASVVKGCVPLNASFRLIYHFWFLKHHHSTIII